MRDPITVVLSAEECNDARSRGMSEAEYGRRKHYGLLDTPDEAIRSFSETRRDIEGPVIVWSNYGCEGWKPMSYATIKDALLSTDRYGEAFVITRKVDFEVTEKPGEK